MKFLFSCLSVLFLVLAIVSFVFSLKHVLSTLERTIPGLSTIPFKTATGTVTDVQMGTSSQSSTTGNTYKSSEGFVTIQFHDEKGHLLEITCSPLVKHFKEKSTVKVFYRYGGINEYEVGEHEKYAKEHNEPVEPASVTGIPVSLLFWIERPAFYFIIGIILLIVRMAPINLKNYLP